MSRSWRAGAAVAEALGVTSTSLVASSHGVGGETVEGGVQLAQCETSRSEWLSLATVGRGQNDLRSDPS